MKQHSVTLGICEFCRRISFITRAPFYDRELCEDCIRRSAGNILPVLLKSGMKMPK